MRDLRHARVSAEVTCVSGAFEALGPAARFVLRAGDDARRAACAALGLDIPVEACRAASAREHSALWLGPDEWLLLAPVTQGASLAATLAGRLQGLPHSLVDVSHRQGALHLTGRYAATLLAAGCPLDLDASAFPIGMCTRTMLAKAEVVLWRTGAEAFHLEVWRSFLPYASLFLAEAARGII
jgi:sarcosine oxidase, subunit gamma